MNIEAQILKLRNQVAGLIDADLGNLAKPQCQWTTGEIRVRRPECPGRKVKGEKIGRR